MWGAGHFTSGWTHSLLCADFTEYPTYSPSTHSQVNSGYSESLSNQGPLCLWFQFSYCGYGVQVRQEAICPLKASRIHGSSQLLTTATHTQAPPTRAAAGSGR
jgi:hypothetical protein